MHINVHKHSSDVELLEILYLHWGDIEQRCLGYKGDMPLSYVWKAKKGDRVFDWVNSCALCEHASLQKNRPMGWLSCTKNCRGIALGLFPSRSFGCETTDNDYAKLRSSKTDQEVKRYIRYIVVELKKRLRIAREAEREKERERLRTFNSALDVVKTSLVQWEMIKRKVDKAPKGEPLCDVWKKEKRSHTEYWYSSCAFCEYASQFPSLDNGELNCQKHCVGISLGLLPNTPNACGSTYNPYTRLLATESDEGVRQGIDGIIKILENTIEDFTDVQTRKNPKRFIKQYRAWARQRRR